MPLLAIAMNGVLVSKLEPRAVLALLGWIAAGTAVFARAVCYDSRALMAEGVRSREAIAAFDDAGMLQSRGAAGFKAERSC